MNHMISRLKNKGYLINDPWDVVTIFENKLAKFSGSKYAVCVDSCSNALFLCLKYLNIKDRVIELPSRTYASVPMQCIHAGNKIRFKDVKWTGLYRLGETEIIDSATRFQKNMYIENSFQCLSFHHRKILKIGRGGAILTNDENFVKWCRPMIYDGRDKNILYSSDTLQAIGYHMYMTPEEAAIGIVKMDELPDFNLDTGSDETYTDLSSQEIFKTYID